MKKEVWKKIQGFDYYLVSNYGRVKSLDKYKRCVSRSGKEFTYRVRGKILKPIPRKMNQYLTYIQHTIHENGKQRCVHAHRLVAETFIPNPDNKPQVNHIDGDGTNNFIKNLEWVTGSENSLHAYKELGRTAWQKGKYGEDAPSSRPVLQKTLDGKLVKRWGCGICAVREGGFDSGCISKCASNKSKTHKGYIWEYETN